MPVPANPLFGWTQSKPHTDLDALWNIAESAGGNAAAALALATTAEADAQTAIAAAAAAQATADEALADAQEALASAGFGIDPRKYGVVGNGIADDTITFNLALQASADLRRVLYCQGLIVRTTGPLTCPDGSGGIFFDVCSFGVPGDPGIFVDGDGFDALTIEGTPSMMQVCVYGTGQTANAVVMDNPQRASITKLRAYNFDGSGIVVKKDFDSVFYDIAAELCGNDTNPAISFEDDAGECNHSHIVRMQAENCSGKVIFVSTSSLNMQFDCIHSEGAVATPGVTTWELGGARSRFTVGRFNATVGADAKLWLRGETTTYANLAAEAGIVVEAEAFTGSRLTIETPNIIGSLTNTIGQTGLITVIGGWIATLHMDPIGIHVYSTQIDALVVGTGPNPPDPSGMVLNACVIGAITDSSALAAATFVNCVVADGNNLLRGYSLFHGGKVTFPTTCSAAGPIRALGTAFIGNLTTNGVVVLDAGASVTGTISGASTPSAGTWVKGMRAANLAPASGQPPGAYCTVSGTPGTWVNEANLA